MRGISLVRPVAGGRLEWMDLLRGSAIVLVILWHAPAIPALFDWPAPEWVTTVNNFFLPFRMPTLVFLSGLLLPASFKKGWRAYYIGKVRSLVWPYLLWVLVFLAQYGSKIPLWHWRAWYATGYLWFLFYIAVYYFIAPVVTKLPAWLTPWLFMIASIVVNTTTEKRLLYFATFFFLGYWLAANPALLTRVRPPLVVGLGIVAVGWGVASSIWGTELAYRGEFALLSIAGILTACWLASRADGKRWTKPLTFVGRNSIVYYVTHFPVITGVVMIAMALGWPRSPYLWVLNLVVAGIVCTGLALARKYPWGAWPYMLPERFVRWALPPTGSQRAEPSSRSY